DEDRPAVLLPADQPGRGAVRLRRPGLPLPGSARPHALPVVPELPPHRHLTPSCDVRRAGWAVAVAERLSRRRGGQRTVRSSWVRGVPPVNGYCGRVAI